MSLIKIGVSRKILLFLMTAAFVVLKSFGQPLPFYDEIQQFKHLDSIHEAPRNAVLFIGSSSFRKWTDVQTYFPNHVIINRAFGGSTFPDLIRYERDIILPYNPRQIVIYCGDNDLASSDTVMPEQVLQRFQIFFEFIRSNYKNISIVYVSIKPSPSREKLMVKMEQTNALIEAFLAHQKNASFVDVYDAMLNPDGKPEPTLFLEDNLHMNAKGYAIWKKALEPVLR